MKPCVHYNYRSLQHTFELLDSEWDDLYKTSGDKFDKINLVWRQLIGFEMRRLPGIDRCVMAQGIYYVTEQKNHEVERSYKFKNSDGDFPIINDDVSAGGLGGDFAVHRFAGPCAWGLCWEGIGKLMSNKNFKLAGLMQSQPEYQPTGCLIL